MIKLCYKNFELGILSYDWDKNEFIYNSLVENEKIAKKSCSALEFYEFFDSKDVRWKKLPSFFGEICACLNRGDIVKLAGIEKGDNLYQKLEKLGKLNLITNGFYIKT